MASPTDIQREMANAWNGRDFGTIRELTHPEFTYMGPDGKEIVGIDATLDITKMVTSAFPDAAMQVKRVFAEGETVIAETVVSGTHRGDFMGVHPTGNRVDIRVCTIMEFRDGKVYRMREYYDMMTTLAQLGVTKMQVEAASAYYG